MALGFKGRPLKSWGGVDPPLRPQPLVIEGMLDDLEEKVRYYFKLYSNEKKSREKSERYNYWLQTELAEQKKQLISHKDYIDKLQGRLRELRIEPVEIMETIQRIDLVNIQIDVLVQSLAGICSFAAVKDATREQLLQCVLEYLYPCRSLDPRLNELYGALYYYRLGETLLAPQIIPPPHSPDFVPTSEGLSPWKRPGPYVVFKTPEAESKMEEGMKVTQEALKKAADDAKAIDASEKTETAGKPSSIKFGASPAAAAAAKKEAQLKAKHDGKTEVEKAEKELEIAQVEKPKADLAPKREMPAPNVPLEGICAYVKKVEKFNRPASSKVRSLRISCRLDGESATETKKKTGRYAVVESTEGSVGSESAVINLLAEMKPLPVRRSGAPQKILIDVYDNKSFSALGKAEKIVTGPDIFDDDAAWDITDTSGKSIGKVILSVFPVPGNAALSTDAKIEGKPKETASTAPALPVKKPELIQPKTMTVLGDVLVKTVVAKKEESTSTGPQKADVTVKLPLDLKKPMLPVILPKGAKQLDTAEPQKQPEFTSSVKDIKKPPLPKLLTKVQKPELPVPPLLSPPIKKSGTVEAEAKPTAFKSITLEPPGKPTALELKKPEVLKLSIKQPELSKLPEAASAKVEKLELPKRPLLSPPIKLSGAGEAAAKSETAKPAALEAAVKPAAVVFKESAASKLNIKKSELKKSIEAGSKVESGKAAPTASAAGSADISTKPGISKPKLSKLSLKKPEIPKLITEFKKADLPKLLEQIKKPETPKLLVPELKMYKSKFAGVAKEKEFTSALLQKPELLGQTKAAKQKTTSPDTLVSEVKKPSLVVTPAKKAFLAAKPSVKPGTGGQTLEKTQLGQLTKFGKDKIDAGGGAAAVEKSSGGAKLLVGPAAADKVGMGGKDKAAVFALKKPAVGIKVSPPPSSATKTDAVLMPKFLPSGAAEKLSPSAQKKASSLQPSVAASSKAKVQPKASAKLAFPLNKVGGAGKTASIAEAKAATLDTSKKSGRVATAEKQAAGAKAGETAPAPMKPPGPKPSFLQSVNIFSAGKEKVAVSPKNIGKPAAAPVKVK